MVDKLQELRNGRAKGKSKDHAGVQICYSFANGTEPCRTVEPGAACLQAQKRAHKCQHCLSLVTVTVAARRRLEGLREADWLSPTACPKDWLVSKKRSRGERVVSVLHVLLKMKY